MEIARVGGPTTAFVPNDSPVGGFPGDYFLSDGSSSVSHNYFLRFDKSVSDLSLDLYDFEASGRTAILSVYADDGYSDLITESTTGGSPIDGGVVNIGVSDSPRPIRTARLRFNIGDNGTGIDNIEFTTISEPIRLDFHGTPNSDSVVFRSCSSRNLDQWNI